MRLHRFFFVLTVFVTSACATSPTVTGTGGIDGTGQGHGENGDNTTSTPLQECTELIVEVSCSPEGYPKVKNNTCLFRIRGENTLWAFGPMDNQCYLFGGSPRAEDGRMTQDSIDFKSAKPSLRGDNGCVCEPGSYLIEEGFLKEEPPPPAEEPPSTEDSAPAEEPPSTEDSAPVEVPPATEDSAPVEVPRAGFRRHVLTSGDCRHETDR